MLGKEEDVAGLKGVIEGYEDEKRSVSRVSLLFRVGAEDSVAVARSIRYPAGDQRYPSDELASGPRSGADTRTTQGRESRTPADDQAVEPRVGCPKDAAGGGGAACQGGDRGGAGKCGVEGTGPEGELGR